MMPVEKKSNQWKRSMMNDPTEIRRPKFLRRFQIIAVIK